MSDEKEINPEQAMRERMERAFDKINKVIELMAEVKVLAPQIPWVFCAMPAPDAFHLSGGGTALTRIGLSEVALSMNTENVVASIQMASMKQAQEEEPQVVAPNGMPPGVRNALLAQIRKNRN